MVFYAALIFYVEPEDETAGDTIKKPEADANSTSLKQSCSRKQTDTNNQDT